MTGESARRALILAWIGAGLIPVFAALGIATGDFLAYWAGVPEGAVPDRPTMLAVGIGSWLVWAAPGILAIVFGIIAFRGGRRTGWIPALLGASTALYPLVLLIAAVVIGGPLGS